jgi:hypothetical protein
VFMRGAVLTLLARMLQVVQTVERVLYASNDEESKRVIAEAQVCWLSVCIC